MCVSSLFLWLFPRPLPQSTRVCVSLRSPPLSPPPNPVSSASGLPWHRPHNSSLHLVLSSFSVDRFISRSFYPQNPISFQANFLFFQFFGEILFDLIQGVFFFLVQISFSSRLFPPHFLVFQPYSDSFFFPPVTIALFFLILNDRNYPLASSPPPDF